METRSRRSTVSCLSSRSSSANPVEISVDSSKRSSSWTTAGCVPMAGLASQTSLVVVPTGAAGATTPLRTRGLEQLRQKIEEELGKGPVTPVDSASPGLTRLRNTPGRGLREKQRELIHKHEQIRQNSDGLKVGGGVTLWPNMQQMRLSGREVALLVLTCLVLMALMAWLFLQLHGETLRMLWKLRAALAAFGETHPVKNSGFQKDLKSSLLAWHSDFRQLLDGVDRSVNVSRPSVASQVYIACYLLSLCVLLYFLADNMFSDNKLSPGRIKKWVCLLVVVAQWTAMLFFMFLSACKLESAIIHNVLQLSEKLGEFVERDLDLGTLSVAVQYWRGRCLVQEGGSGVVQVLGMVPLQDLTVYLGYYLLPLLTLLLTPVVRLCLALHSLYTKKRSK